MIVPTRGQQLVDVSGQMRSVKTPDSDVQDAGPNVGSVVIGHVGKPADVRQRGRGQLHGQRERISREVGFRGHHGTLNNMNEDV